MQKQQCERQKKQPTLWIQGGSDLCSATFSICRLCLQSEFVETGGKVFYFQAGGVSIV